MRTAPIIAGLALVAYAILRFSWGSSDHNLEFLAMRIQDDGSAEWSVLVPANIHPADVTAEVIKQAVKGIERRNASATGCQIRTISVQQDGAIRFDGRRAWTDARRRDQSI